MNKYDRKLTQEKLSTLLGQPLRSVSRGGGSVFIELGELVEKDSLYLTEDKKAAIKKTMVGKYALHIECSSRFSCGDDIILAKRDMFLPNSEIDSQPDFSWDHFDWDVKGNNYFDELVSQHIGEDSYGFIVKEITVSRLGDLLLRFENGFALELFADISGGEECWRFFENDTIEHIVVSGRGIEQNKPDEDALTRMTPQ